MNILGARYTVHELLTPDNAPGSRSDQIFITAGERIVASGYAINDGVMQIIKVVE